MNDLNKKASDEIVKGVTMYIDIENDLNISLSNGHNIKINIRNIDDINIDDLHNQVHSGILEYMVLLSRKNKMDKILNKI